MKRVASLLVTTAIISWSLASPVQADAVTDWNEIAVDTVMAASPPRLGPLGFLDIAVVQASVYDAVQAIGKKYKTYKVEIPGASGSPDAAVAKAARDALVAIFPDKSELLDTTYRGYLTKKNLKENDPGIAVGEKATAGIISQYASTVRGPTSPEPFKGDTKPGMWHPTTSYQTGSPPSGLAMVAPWLGSMNCFVMTSGDQFRAPPPPELTSEQYTRDYNEVKDLGSFSNSKRTEEQTQLAQFYGVLAPNIWEKPLRDLAEKYTDNINDSARLLALVSLAMADASITVWDNKRHYVYWRPVTAIQEGENDGNPATAGDPSWQPFLNTPPYPEYTSGANGITAAFARSLALFFGKDDMTFTVTSSNPQSPQKTKEYKKFSDMASDMVNARIYHGVHFRTADEVARDQGIKVAEWVFSQVGTPK